MNDLRPPQALPHDGAALAELPPPHATIAEHAHVPVHFTRSTRKGVIIFAIGVAFGLSILFVYGYLSRKWQAEELGRESSQGEAAASVETVLVEPGPSDNTLSLPGEARSFFETTIFARTSGYLSKWFVDIGDHVKENQVLALIETPELDDQMAAATAKLNSLKAEVHVAETSADFARLSYDRWEEAAPQGVVSHQERDQKKSELDASVARLESAKAQVALGQADVQRLTTLIGFKQVLAPFDGTITKRDVDTGALVTAGSTTNTTSLFRISQSNRIRVFVDVPQSLAPFIKAGMEVSATAREYPGVKFIGKVDRTAESLDPSSKMLRVQILVPNGDHTLIPGMHLEVSLLQTRKAPPLRVPAGALCFRAAGPQVAVVADGHIQFHDVTIARDLGDLVEIGSGLNANDVVALNVGNDLNDGDRVDAQPLQVETASSTATQGAPATRPSMTASADK